MYENDSFLTLSIAERIGLVCVTLVLSAVLIWLFWLTIKRLNIWLRPLLAMVFLYTALTYLYHVLLVKTLRYNML